MIGIRSAGDCFGRDGLASCDIKSKTGGEMAAATELGRPRLVGDREMAITRVFDAPRERVFQAWIDSDAIGRWWGPRGFSTPPIRWKRAPVDCGSTPCMVQTGPIIRTRSAIKKWKCLERMQNFQDIPVETIRSIAAPTLVIVGDADVMRP
jgi:hypothetical protein